MEDTEDKETVLEEPDITNPSVLIANINELMEVIGKACFCNDYMSEESKEVVKELVEGARYKLISIINKLKVIQTSNKSAMKPKSELEEELFSINYEIKGEEEKLENLRCEWRKQQHQLANLQEQLFTNRRLLTEQTAKACTQGAALAGALYPVFSQPSIIEHFITDSDFISYVKIVTGALSAFANIHSKEMPLNDSPDYKYILFLCRGIIITSTHLPGRSFLLKLEDGQDMIKELVKVLPRIKYPRAESLKIAMLEILKNFAQDTEGSNFLHICDHLLFSIADCINKLHSVTIYRLALNVLASQTRSIDDKYFLQAFINLFDIDILYDFMDHSDKHIKSLAKIIMKDITKAGKQLEITIPERTKPQEVSVHGDACLCRQKQGAVSVSSSTTGHSKVIAKTIVKKSNLSGAPKGIRSKLKISRDTSKLQLEDNPKKKVSLPDSKPLKIPSIKKLNTVSKSCMCIGQSETNMASSATNLKSSSCSKQNFGSTSSIPEKKRSISFALNNENTFDISDSDSAKENKNESRSSLEIDRRQESTSEKSILSSKSSLQMNTSKASKMFKSLTSIKIVHSPEKRGSKTKVTASKHVFASSPGSNKPSTKLSEASNLSMALINKRDSAVQKSITKTHSGQSKVLKGAKIVSVTTHPTTKAAKGQLVHTIVTKIKLFDKESEKELDINDSHTAKPDNQKNDSCHCDN